MCHTVIKVAQLIIYYEHVIKMQLIVDIDIKLQHFHALNLPFLGFTFRLGIRKVKLFAFTVIKDCRTIFL